MSNEPSTSAAAAAFVSKETDPIDSLATEQEPVQQEGAAAEEGVEHFVVEVVPITIEPHTNADSLELACVGDYRSIVKKGVFQEGQLVVYIPEDGVIPAELIPTWVEKGYLPTSALSDPQGSFRVKPIRLRGVLSQGVVVPASPDWVLAQNVKDILHITKWEPSIPTNLPGSKSSSVAAGSRTIKYDIENFKRFPSVFEDGEQCIFTEKIHGTWSQFGVMPSNFLHPHVGDFVISSKGLASKGLCLTHEQSNLYVRAAKQYQIREKVLKYFEKDLQEGRPIFVLGETFGAGVQDLVYGADAQQDAKLGFRVFDIYVGFPGSGKYLDDQDLEDACKTMDLKRVPVLYRGPFSKQLMLEYTNGKETVSGKSLHIREGIVIRPTKERRHPKLGRVQLKSISEKYLLRSGGTEFH